ncbi:hypothetical protein [Halobacterium yunchengense]|uniref:hypothetical protein n=1 Tax=Halobacterium yunchengense TaxID=3108497 RepID=UPI00300936AB
MDVRALLPAGVRDDPGRGRLFALLVLAPTLLGAAHHVDHVVRGNHVGWPLTPHVNAFTYSLAMYPLVGASLALTYADRAGVRYWTAFFAASTGVLAFLHLGPWAVEPPRDVLDPYADPLFGYLAFAVLLGLLAVLVLAAGYAGRLWLADR